MNHPATRKATAAEKAQATFAFLDALINRGEAGVDDAHRLYELPPCVDQRLWGAIIAGLQAANVIRRVGESPTTRRIAHGRRIGRYVASDPIRVVALRDRLPTVAARKQDRQLVLPGFDS